MASDLSSGCTEAIEVLDELEPGEISLEDVSSSEEGHLNYGYGRNQCPNCLSTQHCAVWCTAPPKHYYTRSQRRDAVHGKENRHHIKESGCTGMKISVSTLQEKNDDLVSISSESDLDMEIVGLMDSASYLLQHGKSKGRVKKKRKKKRNPPMLTMDDYVSPSSLPPAAPDCVSAIKHDSVVPRGNSLSRHRKDLSPVHRSTRSRLGPRSPPRRHKSPVRPRSPFKKSRSPFKKSRSPIMRARSPGKSLPWKIPRVDASHAGAHGYSDGHGNVNELLKRVRQLDTMGTKLLEETLNKNREHASSLKEKLSHMMKGVSDNNGNVPNYPEESSLVLKKEANDPDEEEDLAMLRQKALATKQRKSSKRSEQTETETVKKPLNLEDDQDEEDLQLRMIALRSAVLKKHQNRVQKGVKSGKGKKSNASRSESPFTQSFLDSILVPDEQSLNRVSSPHTPTNENNHTTEDMELDTDVEREKEKLPYSPTDKISIDMTMDTELLGIQSSDVSFISLNEANNSPAFAANDPKMMRPEITESYLSSVPYYGGQTGMYEQTSMATPYSPTDPVVALRPDFAHPKRVAQYTVPCGNFGPVPNNGAHVPMEPGQVVQETPYSPSSVLQSLPQGVHLTTTSGSHPTPLSNRLARQAYNRSGLVNGPVEDKTDGFSIESAVGSTTSMMGSLSPSFSMITMNDLPTESLANDPQKTGDINAHLSQNLKEIVPEPLYMQGVPDITKDANKIPTLINRTLVPAPILKSNKQLQQPLPARKHDSHPEPTFKSAEMQPVAIDEEAGTRTNTVFKPMKLMSHAQKPTNVLVTPVAFHDSLQEESIDESQQNGNLVTNESKDDTLTKEAGQSSANDSNVSQSQGSGRKRKRSGKVAHKRKKSDIQKPGASGDNKTAGEQDKRKEQDKKVSVTENEGTKRLKDVQDASTEKRQEKTTDQEKSVDRTSSVTKPDSMESGAKTNQKDKTESKREQSKRNNNDSKGVPNESPDQKTAENRRQSLEEDEEELRAILLASLPKRTKTSEGNHSNKTAANAAPPIVNSTTTSLSKPGSPVVQNKTEIAPQSSLCTENGQTPVMMGDPQRNSKNGVAEAAIPSSTRKRSIPVVKGPQKKMMKKVPIPASTKVVNNAKKYQNAIMQKRLNLQKGGESLYNSQKLLAENKVQGLENKWPTSAKASQLSDTQRIVINLESDTESDSEPERQKTVNKSATNPITKHQPIVNPGTFEKNLDQFLRDVRKKQESVAAARAPQSPQSGKKETAPTTPLEKPNSATLHTPLAVRHLPASQQEEYRRLKQQIIEREKLRLRRTIENKANLKNKTTAVSPNKSSPTESSLIKRPAAAKVQQSPLSKNQTLNGRQLNKENNLKLGESMTITVGNTRKVQVGPAKTINANSQKSTGLPQSSLTTKSIKNISVRITNENAAPANANKTADAATTEDTTIPRATIESTPCSQENPEKSKGPALKVLSKDEVNRRYVQVQGKQTTDAPATIVNNKTNETSETMESESISVNKTVEEKFDETDISELVETVEKEIVASEEQCATLVSVDSDASTVILPGNNRTSCNSESINSSQSTVLLSQNQEETQSSVFSMFATSNDESNSSQRSPSSEGRMSIEDNWKMIRRDVREELNALSDLSTAEQERFLMDTEQKLVMKRYTILDELADMSGNLRQWRMERDLQTSLVAEVRKLREQLRIAEESLQLQRNRIHSIGPRVITAHQKINAGRQECFKLSQVCSVLGTRVVGKDYKVPEAGAQLLENRLKEVASRTRQLSKRKVPSIDIPDTCTVSPTKLCSSVTEAERTDELISTENPDESRTKASESHRSNESNETVTPPRADSQKPEEASAEEPGEKAKEAKNANKGNEANEAKKANEAKEANEANETKEGQTVSCENMDTEPVDSGPAATVHSITPEQDNTIMPDMQPDQCSTPIVSRQNVRERGEPSESAETSPILEPAKEKDCPRTETESQPKKTIAPYVSILTHFKVPRNTNPNGVLCPYELMGTCNDADCQFIHHPETTQAN